MIFAALFILAFLFGFASYAITLDWKVAVAVPTFLFVISTFVGDSVPGATAFTLTFGVPLVFFAGLLGAYVYQIRNFDPDEDQPTQQQEDADSTNTD